MFQSLINFLTQELPSYDNSDLKITFLNITYPAIEIKHCGWKLPSIYKDSPCDKGFGEIIDNQGKLLLNFESFECSKRMYLSLEVLSKDSIRVRYDDYGRSGMLLKRVF
jgi:hypothetical protein